MIEELILSFGSEILTNQPFLQSVQAVLPSDFLKIICGQFLQMAAPGKQSPSRVIELDPLLLMRESRRLTTSPICEPGIVTLLSPRSVLPALYDPEHGGQ